MVILPIRRSQFPIYESLHPKKQRRRRIVEQPPSSLPRPVWKSITTKQQQRGGSRHEGMFESCSLIHRWFRLCPASGNGDRVRSVPRHTRHPAEQVAPGRLSVSVEHYLAVYLRLWDSLGCRIHVHPRIYTPFPYVTTQQVRISPGIPSTSRRHCCLSISLLINSSRGRTLTNLRGVCDQDEGHRILWSKGKLYLGVAWVFITSEKLRERGVQINIRVTYIRFTKRFEQRCICFFKYSLIIELIFLEILQIVIREKIIELPMENEENKIFLRRMQFWYRINRFLRGCKKI